MSKSFFGHPMGLSTLFATEFWERFSYYGMRALLVLYLTATFINGGFGYNEEQALQLYAIFTGLVYITPILGGIISDKWWGQRKTVYTGAIIIAFGQFALAFSSLAIDWNPVFREQLLFIGLGILILGNGLFKPNISTMVGALYEPNDPRRDGGFTLFYMGINAGAFFSPLVAGSLGEKVGWHYGFMAAGVGMVISIAWLFLRHHTIGNVGMPPGYSTTENKLKKKDSFQIIYYSIFGTLLVTALVLLIGLIPRTILNWTIYSILAAITIYLVFTIGKNTKTSDEKSRAWVIVILAVMSIVFWAGFEQSGGTFNLFARDSTDRTISFNTIHIISWIILTPLLGMGIYNLVRFKKSFKGWLIAFAIIFASYLLMVFRAGSLDNYTMPASLFQAINPLVIFIFGPIFSYLWIRLEKSKLNPSTPAKFAWALLLLSIGFGLMTLANHHASNGNLVSPFWLIGVFAIHTFGELCLSPIGLSMVTKLAPQKIVSLMMGLWFFCSAIGNYLAGVMKSIVSKFNLEVFSFLAIETFIFAIIAFIIAPYLNQKMRGIK